MRRQDLDRVVDEEAVALNAFFHASRAQLRPGQVLEGRCRKHVNLKSPDGVDYEDFVEAHRPPWEVSRDCAMYSTQSKEALSRLASSGKYVYEVEPIGHVTAADFWQFIELMGEPYVSGNPDASKFATNYWSSVCRDDEGRPCVPRADATEYLSPALRVIREDVEAVGYEPRTYPDPRYIGDPTYRQRWVRGVGVVEEVGLKKSMKKQSRRRK